MSIERLADDVAEFVDRVAGGGPVDLWGFSLGALTATGVAVRHPSKVRRLVLAAVNIRPDGYHPESTAPDQDDPRLPTEQEGNTTRRSRQESGCSTNGISDHLRGGRRTNSAEG